jgi:alkanesulfonate monooxygenase SsuD/methylene tetrahydromethanopterin reductase-like flavin-dependent oxidoreductase (luciferase family)
MTEPDGVTAAATRGITVLRGGVERVAATAAAAEAAGFGSVWAPEFYTRSAVVTLTRMAIRTTTARVGSSIACAGLVPLLRRLWRAA